jgi:hypothetical protein
MSTQNGTDIILIVDGERFAALTSNGLSLSQSSREVTNKSSGGYKQFEYGLREASMSGVGYILASVKNLLRFSETMLADGWDGDADLQPLPVEGPTAGLINAAWFAFGPGQYWEQETISVAAGTYRLSMWVLVQDEDLTVLVNGDDTVITATGVYQRVEIPVVLGSPGTITVRFEYPGGLSSTVFIQGLQLESGSVATLYQPSEKKWSHFVNAILNRTKVECYITDQTGWIARGEAVVGNVSITASAEDNAEVSAEFSITGLVEVDVIP